MKKVKVSFDTWISTSRNAWGLGGLIFVGLEIKHNKSLSLHKLMRGIKVSWLGAISGLRVNGNWT